MAIGVARLTWRRPADSRSTPTSTWTPPATPPRTSSARASTSDRSRCLGTSP